MPNDLFEEQKLLVEKARQYLVLRSSITERHRADDALFESERRFQTMIDALPAAVYTTDAEGRLTHFNPAAVTFSGFVPEVGTDRWCVNWKLYHPDGTPMPHNEGPMATALKEGRAIRDIEAIAERPDGTRVWFIPHPTPLLDADGKVVGGINMLVDITERKRRELDLAFLADMLSVFAPHSSSADIMRVAGERIASHLHLTHCALVEIDEAAGECTVIHDHHPVDTPSLVGVYRITEYHTEAERREMAAGKAMAINDVSRDPRSASQAEKFAALEIGAIANASHIADGQWKFVLSAGTRLPRVWLANEIDLLSEMATRIYLRLERARAEEALRERSLQLRSALDALKTEIAVRSRLEREILEISERDQFRIGQDLHDGLGQELAGIALLGKVLANTLAAEAHPSAKAAADLAAFINDTIQSARRLAMGLYPVELNRYGLLVALEDLSNQTSQRLGICCELHQCGKVLKLAKSVEIHIYRIVQECITNAIKHGDASRIIIESIEGGGAHTFTVTDNGSGFEEPADGHGMGLHIITYRAGVIGADIDVRRPAEGGCRVTCRLPV